MMVYVGCNSNAAEYDKMKVRAYLYEDFEGSDDPRAIQGGGGAHSKLVGVVRNSRYLIEAYVRAYYNRYGDTLRIQYLKGL